MFEAEPDVRWVEHPQSHKGIHQGSGRHSHRHTNSRELMLSGKMKIPSDKSVHLRSRTCRCESDLRSADHCGVCVDCGLHGNKVMEQVFMAVFTRPLFYKYQTVNIVTCWWCFYCCRWSSPALGRSLGCPPACHLAGPSAASAATENTWKWVSGVAA